MEQSKSSVYEMAKESQSSTRPSLSNVQHSTASVNKKSSSINCCICLSKFLDPASLTCGHRFCENCLQNYWDSSEKPRFIICPLCRKQVSNINFTKKPSSSFNEFRKTFSYLDMVSEHDPTTTLTCLLISLLLPAVYYIGKWFGLPRTLLQLYNGMRSSFKY